MLFPADTTSGAGSPGSAPPAATPPPHGAAASTTAAPSSGDAGAPPAEDWKAKYSDLESRHRAWSEFGDDPAKVREALQWARERAAEIQAGKLTYSQQQELQRQQAQSSQDDPFNRWDELSPTEQRDLMRSQMQREFQTTRDQMLSELRKPIEQQAQTLQTQQQIFMQASRLSAETGIPFEDAIAEATRLASMSTPDLIKMAFDAKASPKRQQQAIDQAVQQALAAEKARRENAEAEALFVRNGGRFLKEPSNPAERRTQGDKRVAEVIRRETRRVAMGGAE